MVEFLAKWRWDSEEPRGRESASTCESRPAPQPGKITQRLELTSLWLANHLVTSAHPIQWELCLDEGYQVWPHIHSAHKHRLSSDLNCILLLMSAPPYRLHFN